MQLDADALLQFVIFTAAFTLLALFSTTSLRNGRFPMDAAVGTPALLLGGLHIALSALIMSFLLQPQKTRRDVRAALDVIRRSAIVAIVSLGFDFLLVSSSPSPTGSLKAALVVGGAYLILDSGTYLLLHHRQLPKSRVVPLVRSVGALYVGEVSIGVLIPVLYPSLHEWAVVTLLGLVVVIRYNFNLYLQVRESYECAVGTLVRAIELQSPETTGHSERVAMLAVSIGRQLGLQGRDLEDLRWAALLHDIGKLGLEEQRAHESRDHAIRGGRLVQKMPFLAHIAPAITHHHDGVLPAASGNRSLALIIGVASRIDNEIFLNGRTPARVVEDLLRREPREVVLAAERVLLANEREAVGRVAAS